MRFNKDQENMDCTFDLDFSKAFKTKNIARTQLTPWHKNVAQATPATPILKTVTNRMSNNIARDEVAKNKWRLESPRAVKIFVDIL